LCDGLRVLNRRTRAFVNKGLAVCTMYTPHRLQPCMATAVDVGPTHTHTPHTLWVHVLSGFWGAFIT
jgi:hypothetical protein